MGWNTPLVKKTKQAFLKITDTASATCANGNQTGHNFWNFAMATKNAHISCPKPLPIHFIVPYIGCQPFCNAVRIQVLSQIAP